VSKRLGTLVPGSIFKGDNHTYCIVTDKIESTNNRVQVVSILTGKVTYYHFDAIVTEYNANITVAVKP
jgi:hypothetical protein